MRFMRSLWTAASPRMRQPFGDILFGSCAVVLCCFLFSDRCLNIVDVESEVDWHQRYRLGAAVETDSPRHVKSIMVDRSSLVSFLIYATFMSRQQSDTASSSSSFQSRDRYAPTNTPLIPACLPACLKHHKPHPTHQPLHPPYPDSAPEQLVQTHQPYNHNHTSP